MGSPFTLVAKVRKPTRVLTRPWEAYIEASGRNSRGKDFSNSYFDPYARAVMLNPQIDPEASAFVNPKAGYSLYVGNPSVYAPNAWTEGEGAFGDSGMYVGFAGNATYPATTPWTAYRTPSYPILENQGINIVLYWSPPGGDLVPEVEIWPRVDFTKYATFNGYTYFFAPLSFNINAQLMTLTVHEYEYDSYDQFYSQPAMMMRPLYQHKLELGAMGLSRGWLSLKVLPVLEKWTSADDGLTYRYHDFVVHSPQLRNGGFCYRTKVKRTATSLFPYGCPGIASRVGGLCCLSIAPIWYPTDGYFVTQTFSKREEDTERPTVDSDLYLPTGSAVGYQLVRPADSYPTPLAIPVGDAFQQYRVQVSLQASTDDNETPVIYNVKPSLEGTTEDRAQDELDISDDVTIHESMSDDLTGYSARVTLRNRNGQYDHLVSRILNEITLKVQGVDRAVLYTTDPGYKWYETPTHSALRIEWQCGDFWQRMKSIYISGHPDYGNKSIKDALTDYFENIGFDTTKVHIADSLDEVFLPYSPNKEEPLCKPQDGSTADEFVADMREKYFSTYPTGFDGVGEFWVAEPLDPLDPANIKRTYYLSLAQADAAGETNPYFCGNPEVRVKHEEYRNEIWVVGLDPQTKEPIVSMWLDKQSQTDESYLYYVGERRLMVAVTLLPTEALVSGYLNELKKVFSHIRRHVGFETKYDPLLMPGDFIKFRGISAVFQVLSTDQELAVGRISLPNDSDAHDGAAYGCRVEALEYPASIA